MEAATPALKDIANVRPECIPMMFLEGTPRAWTSSGGRRTTPVRLQHHLAQSLFFIPNPA
jgi:hypothetical protein